MNTEMNIFWYTSRYFSIYLSLTKLDIYVNMYDTFDIDVLLHCTKKVNCVGTVSIVRVVHFFTFLLMVLRYNYRILSIHISSV